MAKSIAAYGALARRIGPAMQEAKSRAVRQTVVIVRDATDRSVRDALPSMNLSRVGSAGASVRIAGKFAARPRPHGEVRAVGPLHLFDLDTRPHRIAAKRKKALLLPDGFAAEVSHPGTRGKRSFERGVRDGERRARVEIPKATTTYIIKRLR